MDEQTKVISDAESDNGEISAQPDAQPLDAEQTPQTAQAEGDISPQEEETEGKKKRPLPPFLQKIVSYLKEHEDIRQMVLFFLFSLICGATQFIITLVLPLLLNLIPSLKPSFSWFLFIYPTTGEFIGFLVGSIVGQVLTFVLNRKKTFNVPDYVALRAVLYAIMAILIILMQTYLGGVVTSACQNAAPNASELLKSVFNITGQAVAGIAALIINFLGNKFFIMRDWGGKKKKAALEAAADMDGTSSDAEPSVADTATESSETADEQE